MKKELVELRKVMEKEGVDYYYIPTSDYHESEYVGDYFQARKFISGFSGSAGYLLVGLKEAILWTDGRYFVQAEMELENSGISLYKMGLDNVPTIKEYLKSHLKKDDVFAFDARVVNVANAIEFKGICDENYGEFKDCDLVSEIWKNRPALSKEKAFYLNEKYSGESIISKLAKLRDKIRENHCDSMVLSSLDEINYLFNIRGNDIAYTPHVLSFAIVGLDRVSLYIDQSKLNDEIREELEIAGVEIYDYEEVYRHANELEEQVLCDFRSLNYRLYLSIRSAIVNRASPLILMKSIKNKVQIENMKIAHIKDGITMAKFMYWLKTNVNKIKMDEVSIQDKLAEIALQQENCFDLSFNTICGFKDHGAIIHYSATKESAYEVSGDGLLLVDSGRQYLEGTTDITRTYAIGNVSLIEKEHYTAVLRGLINLSLAKYQYGVRGVNLDILARQPIWELGLDYRTGTGHGIGFVSGVHEAPNGIRWRIVPERNDSCILEEGMFTTNEPGIYLDYKYGIRLENVLLTAPFTTNEYGRFLQFETITFAPFDLELVLVDKLTSIERKWLNDYHKEVYDKLQSNLTNEERVFLKECTREI